jgi:hypothetical protein
MATKDQLMVFVFAFKFMALPPIPMKETSNQHARHLSKGSKRLSKVLVLCMDVQKARFPLLSHTENRTF